MKLADCRYEWSLSHSIQGKLFVGFVKVSSTDGTLLEIHQGGTTMDKVVKPDNTLAMGVKHFLSRNGSHRINYS